MAPPSWRAVLSNPAAAPGGDAGGAGQGDRQGREADAEPGDEAGAEDVGQVGRVGGLGAGRRVRIPAASNPTPRGMLTNSTHRQFSSAVRTPPRTTPTEPADPPMMLHRARARCRWCSSVWLAVMRLRLVGGQRGRARALDDPGREQHGRISG